jgi:hypothetical protein
MSNRSQQESPIPAENPDPDDPVLMGIGPYALKDMEISSEGTRPNIRYGIRMDEGKIEIVY